MVAKGKSDVSQDAQNPVEKMPTESTTVVHTESPLSEEQLREFTSFEDFVQEFGRDSTRYISDILGNGFTVLATNDKSQLEGVPFFIVQYRANVGNQGPFSTLMVVTRTNEKLIVNDGSTGIHKQCEQLVDAGVPIAGTFVPGGLRRSDYEHPEHGWSTTFYLSTDATA